MKKFLLLCYPLVAIALLVYSYTQVDLNLTLFRSIEWLSFQKWAQEIGYFQRQTSVMLFFAISLLLFAFYIAFLKLSSKLSKKEIWFLILSTAFILFFSYNAFSYDLFNYIFDAKIVTVYNKNPYMHTALDFPGDPMLLFMHWTHRVFPYGPTWLGATVPLSFLGQNVFIPTLFLFKGLMVLCYLGTVYYISKILKVVSPKDEKFGTLFFALNPLVVVESLVSAHNDIVMVFLATFALYKLVSKKYLSAFPLLGLSAGVKFASGLLLPIFAYVFYKKGKVDWDKMFVYSIIFMTLGVVLASVRTSFQPWYLLNVLPITALIARKDYILVPTIIVCLFALANYLPFLYLGNWDNPVPTILFWLTTVSVIISLFIIGSKYRKI